jgi:hypothetical protein
MKLLLLIAIGLMPVVSLANVTTKQQPRMLVEYSNVLVKRWVLIQQLRDRLYVKTQGEKQEKKKHRSKNIPDAEQASPDAEVQRWKQRQRKYHPAQGRAARGVSSALRKQNLRGGYHLAYTGTQTKRQMYQTSYRSVSHGECL